MRKFFFQVGKRFVCQPAEFSRVKEQICREEIRFFLLLPGLFRFVEVVVNIMTYFMSDSEVLTLGSVVPVYKYDFNSPADGNTAAESVVKVYT